MSLWRCSVHGFNNLTPCCSLARGASGAGVQQQAEPVLLVEERPLSLAGYVDTEAIGVYHPPG